MPEMRCNAFFISHHFRVLRSVCVRYARVITIQSWVTQTHADGEEECPQHRCIYQCRKRFVEHLNRVYIGVGSLLVCHSIHRSDGQPRGLSNFLLSISALGTSMS